MGDISIQGRSPILRQGYAVGGAVQLGKALAKKFKKKKVYPETEDLTHQVGPYIGDVGSEGKRRKGGRQQRGKSRGKSSRDHYGQGKSKSISEAGYKKGGWIQKATASIKKRGTKGKCTPITKPGCTGRAKALAKTFKKMAKKRKPA